MRKTLLAIFAAAAVITPLSVHAEERSPASAFAFIKDKVTDGSWSGAGRFCYANGSCYYNGHKRIIGLSATDQSYCILTFTMAIGGTQPAVTRKIDLTRQFVISYNGNLVTFEGPVVVSNGDIIPSWNIKGPSFEVGVQVGKALQFIQSSCRQKSVWETEE